MTTRWSYLYQHDCVQSANHYRLVFREKADDREVARYPGPRVTHQHWQSAWRGFWLGNDPGCLAGKLELRGCIGLDAERRQYFAGHQFQQRFYRRREPPLIYSGGA